MGADKVNPIDIEVISSSSIENKLITDISEYKRINRELNATNAELRNNVACMQSDIDEKNVIIQKLTHTIEVLRNAQLQSDKEALEQRRKSDILITEMSIKSSIDEKEISTLRGQIEQLESKLKVFTLGPIVTKEPALPDVAIPAGKYVITPCSKNELLYVGWYLNNIRIKSKCSINDVAKDTHVSKNIIITTETDTKSKLSVKLLMWYIKHQSDVTLDLTKSDSHILCDWLKQLRGGVDYDVISRETGIKRHIIEKMEDVHSSYKQVYTKLICWYIKQIK